MCHRTILICRYLRNEGVLIKHILADGAIETNAELEERLMKQLKIPQDDLFMDHEQLVNRAYDMQSDKIAYVAEEKQNYNSEE
jgi:ribosome-associated protein YbcJ (S4-like RNA binding protein)